MDFQQPQRAGFIGTHLAAKAHHVGEHDGLQLTGLGRSHAAVLLSWGQLSPGRLRASRKRRETLSLILYQSASGFGQRAKDEGRIKTERNYRRRRRRDRRPRARQPPTPP